MDPDWQPDATDLAREEAQSQADEPAISAEESRLPAAAEDAQIARLEEQRQQLQLERDSLAQKLAHQVSEQESLAARLAEQQLKFEAARDEWAHDREALANQMHEQALREREELAQELALRGGEQQAVASRLAEEQRKFQAALATWEQERAALAHQIEKQSQHLARLEDELTVVRREPVSESIPAIATETRAESFSENEQPAEPSAAADAIELSSAVDPIDLITVDSPAAQDDLLAHSVAEATIATVPQSRAASSSMGRSPRRKTDGRDLTDFVSGRLFDIEGSKRRRTLLVWAAVGVAAAALSTVVFSVWTWMS